jgi:hypothetical protein
MLFVVPVDIYVFYVDYGSDADVSLVLFQKERWVTRRSWFQKKQKRRRH